MSPRALGSRYLLDEPIGEGGMGVVWRGRDRETGLQYAIKVLRPEFASDPNAVARFVRERTALVTFRHQNVVTVHDTVMEGNRLALIMDLIHGGDLHAYRKRRGGKLAPAEAAQIIAQVCDGLAAAHAVGIVHRDLKPANILLDGGHVWLADFGIARMLGEPASTTTGTVMGTVHYMAPESISGQDSTAASDVYGAGVTMYELLAGELPFTGHAAAIMHGHMTATPSRPDGVPDQLWILLSSCLSKSPADRPTAAALSTALRACLPGPAELAPVPLAAAPVAAELIQPPVGAPFQTGAATQVPVAWPTDSLTGRLAAGPRAPGQPTPPAALLLTPLAAPPSAAYAVQPASAAYAAQPASGTYAAQQAAPPAAQPPVTPPGDTPPPAARPPWANRKLIIAAVAVLACAAIALALTVFSPSGSTPSAHGTGLATVGSTAPATQPAGQASPRPGRTRPAKVAAGDPKPPPSHSAAAQPTATKSGAPAPSHSAKPTSSPASSSSPTSPASSSPPAVLSACALPVPVVGYPGSQVMSACIKAEGSTVILAGTLEPVPSLPAADSEQIQLVLTGSTGVAIEYLSPRCAAGTCTFGKAVSELPGTYQVRIDFIYNDKHEVEGIFTQAVTVG
jgi:Protein kinase domain